MVVDKAQFCESTPLAVPIPALLGESNRNHPWATTAFGPEIIVLGLLVRSHVCTLPLTRKIFL